MRRWFAAALVLTLAAAARAEEWPKLIATATITGGKTDLKDEIVAIPMPVIENPEYWGIGVIDPKQTLPHVIMSEYLAKGRLGSPDGKPELLVLLPELKAGASLTLQVRKSPPPPGFRPPPPLTWNKVGGDTIELRYVNMFERQPKSKPVARFTRFTFDASAVPKDKVLTNPTIKPYHHVFDAAG